MTWFTETPWPPVLALLMGAVLWAGVRYRRQQLRSAAVGFGLCIMLAGAVWYVERQIVTPREQVERSVMEITSSFQRGDTEATLGHISPHAVDVIGLVLFADKVVRVEDDMHVSDVQVEMSGRQTRSTARFRVNATISAKHEPLREYQPTRWETKWQLEGGRWRMVAIQELDPLTGEELDRFNWLRRRISGM